MSEQNGQTTATPAEATAPAQNEGAEQNGSEHFDKERALATIKTQRESESAAKKRASELEAQLKEYQDRDKSEQEKLNERAQGAEQRATAAETKLLRHEVAAAKGIPAKLAGRLHGSSREEMEADADELLETLGRAEDRRPAGGFDPGRRGGGEAPRSMDDLIRSGRSR